MTIDNIGFDSFFFWGGGVCMCFVVGSLRATVVLLVH
jgi:hypothetical protein